MNHLFPRVTVPAIAAVLRHPWQSFKSTGYRTMTYLLPFHEDELAHLQDPLERKKLVYQFLFNFYSRATFSRSSQFEQSLPSRLPFFALATRCILPC